MTDRKIRIRRNFHSVFLRVLNRFAGFGETRWYKNNLPKKEEKFMEESKRKEIEARLVQLFAQNYQNKEENQPTKSIPSGVKAIRRRKGKPDLYIS